MILIYSSIVVDLTVQIGGGFIMNFNLELWLDTSTLSLLALDLFKRILLQWLARWKDVSSSLSLEYSISHEFEGEVMPRGMSTRSEVPLLSSDIFIGRTISLQCMENCSACLAYFSVDEWQACLAEFSPFWQFWINEFNFGLTLFSLHWSLC